MKKLLRQALFATAATIALALPALAQTIKFNMHESFVPTNISSIAAADFARIVKEKSGGKIEITIHYSGSLGIAENALLQAVEKGVVPLSSTIYDKLLGTLPVAGIQFVPFMASSLDDAAALFAATRPYVEKQLNRENQILLFETIGVPVGLWSKVPVKDMASVRSLKMRTNNPNTTKTFQNAGASPTFMSWADVPAALGTGVIDSVVTTGESGLVARFYEQLPHYAALNMEIGFWLVHMHKPTFDGLSPDLQKAVLDSAAEARRNAYARVKPRLEENTKKMKENGVTVLDPVPAELLQPLAKAGEPLLQEWRKKVGEEAAKSILTTYEATRPKTK